MVFKISLFIVISIGSHVQASEVFVGDVSYVTDGDTLWVQPQGGGPARKLRIEGIDAPEICQVSGETSREALARLALHQRVLVTVKRHDSYGRGLAHIQLNDHDMGAMMVRAGQAWSYRWHRSLGPYAAEEADARHYRRGLFAINYPELPREFRKRHGPCHIAR